MNNRRRRPCGVTSAVWWICGIRDYVDMASQVYLWRVVMHRITDQLQPIHAVSPIPCKNSLTSLTVSIGCSACTQCPASRISRRDFGKNCSATGIFLLLMYFDLAPLRNNVGPDHVGGELAGSYGNSPMEGMALLRMDKGTRNTICASGPGDVSAFVSRNCRVGRDWY